MQKLRCKKEKKPLYGFFHIFNAPFSQVGIWENRVLKGGKKYKEMGVSDV